MIFCTVYVNIGGKIEGIFQEIDCFNLKTEL